MALTTEAPGALARIYASSILELAKKAGAGNGQPVIESTLGELEDVLEIARSDAKFGEFLSSRILGRSERAASLDRIFKGRVSDLTLRFLQVLNQKDRLAHLPQVVAALDQMVQAEFGRVEVDVYTASPISTEELGAIRARLATVLGKEPIVHPYTDNAMIGGLKLQIGDQLIDASVATRLRQLRDRLATDGATKVRSKIDDLID